MAGKIIILFTSGEYRGGDQRRPLNMLARNTFWSLIAFNRIGRRFFSESAVGGAHHAFMCASGSAGTSVKVSGVFTVAFWREKGGGVITDDLLVRRESSITPNYLLSLVYLGPSSICASMFLLLKHKYVYEDI